MIFKNPFTGWRLSKPKPRITAAEFQAQQKARLEQINTAKAPWQKHVLADENRKMVTEILRGNNGA